MIKKIAFVGQPTKDLEGAKKFYEKVLGLELDADYGELWSEYQTADGTTIALDTISPTKSPSHATYLALETDDIDQEVARIRESGAQVLQDVWENRDGEGRCICKMAIVLDPDGNPIMLHEIAAWRAKP